MSLKDSILEIIERRVDSADVQGTPEGMAEEIAALVEQKDKTEPEVRQVGIGIFNRKGLGGHTETIDFTDFDSLRVKVDELVEGVPFHKVNVELTPNWTVTEDEQKVLNSIETE